jgi:CubicO group peptidase (beta-lactamase class C family)
VSPRSGRAAAALAPAFDLAASQVADGTAPFVILAVADRDGILRAEAHAGPSAAGVGVGAACLLASITKPIVATGVMQLVADGRVALTDPVARYVPELADPEAGGITIWHLLTHTSGLADHDLDTILASGRGRAAVERSAVAAPVEFPPGSRYDYVSSTFDLLALVIERVTGSPYPTSLRRTVWEPLGMAHTTFDPSTSGTAIAPTWRATPDADVPWEPIPMAARDAFAALGLAGGGLWSTAGDLVRFGRAMLRGGELDGARVLPAAFVELMTREQTTDGLGAAPDPIHANHYALGWGKPDPHTTPGSSAAFGHGGVSGTRLWIDPAHDLIVVYLTGVWGYPLRPIDVVVQAVYSALG